MKKKIVAVTLAAAMVMSMTACGGSGDTATTAAAAADTTAAATDTTAAAAGEVGSEAAESKTEETQAASGDITDLAAYAEEGMETSIDCEPIELSLACSGTVDGTIMGDAIEAAIAAVSKWTNGNFVVTFYPGGQLGGDTELIQAVQMGSVDIFTGATTGQVGMVPELAVTDIGGLFADMESCNNVLKGYYDQFEAAYNKVGLHLETIYAPDFRELTSSKPINTVEDLKGLNIRVQENEYHMAFWSELGCNATPLAFGELYIALQQGMMDAQENPWGSIVGAKLYEVQPYITLTHHIPFISTYVVNQASYEALSDSQKLALDQFCSYVEKYQIAGTAEDDAKLQAVAEAGGCTVSEASDDLRTAFQNAAEPVIELLKKNGIDADFVDGYVAAARAQ